MPSSIRLKLTCCKVLLSQIYWYHKCIIGWFADLNQPFKPRRFYDLRKRWAGMIMMVSLVVTGPWSRLVAKISSTRSPIGWKFFLQVYQSSQPLYVSKPSFRLHLLRRCILSRVNLFVEQKTYMTELQQIVEILIDQLLLRVPSQTVSYTHLTLPTKA